jgi:single-stranded-DNA-specific exonuclease
MMNRSRPPRGGSLDWQVAADDPRLGAVLARGLGISLLLARLLVNRGVRDLPAGQRFLQPSLDGLHDPALLPGLPAAVDRLRRALRQGERIIIYGDYDVDGVTGTAILYRALRLLGAEAECYIPHRLEEGYGLCLGAVERLASGGAGVLLTVDCGTSDVEEVRRAQALGLDVIVTDHHEAPEVLPESLALVNPKVPGSAYPGREISGSGVAFKLAWALLQTLPESARRAPPVQDFLLEAMALVALGTVADVAPLVGENRVFAAYGLGAIRHCRNAGLRALLARSGVDDREAIQTSHLAFRLGPRLNAGGRLGSALPSLRLFLSDDPAEAESIADALDKANTDRQRVEARILEEARERIAAEFDLASDRALVLADERWHPGVIGIVASRLVEEFRRPVVLVALADGRGRGSGRSVAGFPLHEALARCRPLLGGCGGHAMAAGLEIDGGQVEAFRRRLLDLAAEAFPDALPVPVLAVDAEVTLDRLGVSVARELERLGPHGAGNTPPVLAVRGARIAGEPRRMGRDGSHISFLAHQNGASLRAVWWGAADEMERRLNGARRCDIAFALSTNAWSGSETVELTVKDLKAV